ncbi:ankyrin repeat domain-containing protein [Aporhodopirellula aestuarii]|uniref:Ankyrin repeat domain-containing protein n=1 Tax=Aporhodopirellula aestuarii TaxID=2950107 RepID=A0ABT0UDX1_9BACT|nr:ankyrin repeat domain-containing protein [Aporhodopirellula aestuarii]MCM2374961.1 ankyrin repeat domain-containing protein [Aporhodopirellula aestuarii]
MKSNPKQYVSKFVVALCALVSTTGCGPERLKPEDLPRRERDEVIIPAPTQSEQAMAGRETPSEPDAAPEPDADALRDEAFREAAMQGDLNAVKKFAAEGSEIDAVGPGGRTALQLAAFDGHLKTVNWLIDQHAEVNHRDEFGRTALMYAATGPNASTVKALLGAGADIELVDGDEHFNALMFAAAEGQVEVVKILLDGGADRDVKDIDGETAMDFATANGHEAVIELLAR